MEWISNIIYWHWLILAVTLIILEILIPGAYLLWMGIASIVVSVVMFIFPQTPILSQVLIFTILSIITVMMYRMYKKKNPVVTNEPALNRRGEHYLGRDFTLTAPIVDGLGKIKVDDSTWKIAGMDVPEGTIVRVVSVEGAMLKVETVK